MSLNSIDGKFLEVKLKNNWTLDNFVEHFAVSKEEFVSALKSKFSEKSYKMILRRMEKNAKISKRTAKVDEEVEKPEKIEEILNEDPIASLKANIEAVQKEIREVEKKHEDALSRKKSLCETVSSFDEHVKKLERDIENTKQIIRNLTSQVNEASKEIYGLKTFEDRLKANLDEYNAQLKELEKVIVHCFEDGTIECEVTTRPESWKGIFDKLSYGDDEDEDFINLKSLSEEFTIKEVKQMAQIFALIEVVESEEKSFELHFESETQVSVALEMFDFPVVYES